MSTVKTDAIVAVSTNGNLDLSGQGTGGVKVSDYLVLTKGADIASATALTLGKDGSAFDVTGTTAISSIGTQGIGSHVTLHFDGALTFTHHATDLILPGGANITTAAGDIAVMYEYASGDWRCVSYTKASGEAVVVSGGGGLQSMQIFTSGGTWNKPVGINSVRVFVVGGGGSGGTGSGSGAGGGGGGGGGCAVKLIDVSAISSETVTIGTGGASQATGSTDGNAGNTSSFGAHCSATGGGGGKWRGNADNGASGAGGVGASGDINLTGGEDAMSQTAYSNTGSGGAPGARAAGPYGGTGGRGSDYNTTNAGSGEYGGGGGGGPGGAQASGAGGDGIIVIEEYA